MLSNTRTDYIVGSRRPSNYFWAVLIMLAGFCFILAGFSSYLQVNLLPFTVVSNLSFLPQGATMVFYGTIAIFLAVFLWLTIVWNVGGGYNQFDKPSQTIQIVRFGFPGKNRRIKLQYAWKEIKSIKVIIKEGLNPKREILLKTKDLREIPITKVGQLISLSQLEKQATDLALFLNVILEMP